MRLKLYEEKDRNYCVCVYRISSYSGQRSCNIHFSQGGKGYDYKMYEFQYFGRGRI